MKNIFKKIASLSILSFVFSVNFYARENSYEEEFPIISNSILDENSDFKIVCVDYARFLIDFLFENSGMLKAIRTKEQAEKMDLFINNLITKLTANKEFLELTKVIYDKQLISIKEMRNGIKRIDTLEKVLTPFLFATFVVSKFSSVYNQRNKFLKYFSVFSESALLLSIINCIKNFSKKEKIEKSFREYSFAKSPENIKVFEFFYKYLNKYQSEIEEILLLGVKKSEISNENEVESKNS